MDKRLYLKNPETAKKRKISLKTSGKSAIEFFNKTYDCMDTFYLTGSTNNRDAVELS
ncbi:hypothetical protein BH09BAC6_BH09BAC6_07930 [soil metagenome]